MFCTFILCVCVNDQCIGRNVAFGFLELISPRKNCISYRTRTQITKLLSHFINPIILCSSFRTAAIYALTYFRLCQKWEWMQMYLHKLTSRPLIWDIITGSSSIMRTLATQCENQTMDSLEILRLKKYSVEDHGTIIVYSNCSMAIILLTLMTINALVTS